MARVARPIDTQKIASLRERLKDPQFVDGAVERLAGRIADHILGLDEGRDDQRAAIDSRIVSALRRARAE